MTVGRPRTLPDAEPRACRHCGTVFTPERKYAKKRIYCCATCQRAAVFDHSSEAQSRRSKKRWADYSASTEDYARPDGYIVTNRRGRKELLHRVVAEAKIGRPLEPGEVVHHVNHDPTDNRFENIEVLTGQGDHARLHARERRGSVE